MTGAAYLAPVSHYMALRRTGTMPHEPHWLNRCRICSPRGPLTLTIPLEHSRQAARISDHGNWRHRHWNALKSAYGGSPYFQFYEDDFAPFYERHWEYLADYNEELERLVCRLLDISPDIRRAEPCQGTQPLKAVFDFIPYTQMFSQGFIPDLSIVDLLFNMGPESVLYL